MRAGARNACQMQRAKVGLYCVRGKCMGMLCRGSTYRLGGLYKRWRGSAGWFALEHIPLQRYLNHPHNLRYC